MSGVRLSGGDGEPGEEGGFERVVVRGWEGRPGARDLELESRGGEEADGGVGLGEEGAYDGPGCVTGLDLSFES